MSGGLVQVKRGEVWRTHEDGSWYAIGLVDRSDAEGGPARTWRATSLDGVFLGCGFAEQDHAVDEVVRDHEQRCLR